MGEMQLMAHIDMTEMRKALDLAFKFTRSGPKSVIDNTALHVARKAMEYTKAVSQETIVAELGVKAFPRKTRWKGFKKRQRGPLYYSDRKVAVTTAGRTQEMPLAAAIIQSSVLMPFPTVGGGARMMARAMGKKETYNVRTGFRWARAASPFRGRTREAGRQAMRETVHAMIAARKKSTAFLKAGWAAVLKKLGRNVALRAVKYDDDFGDVRRAWSGTTYSLEIVNRIGFRRGKKGWADHIYNRKLIEYGTEPLQRGVNEEARTKLEYYWQRALRQALPMFFR